MAQAKKKLKAKTKTKRAAPKRKRATAQQAKRTRPAERRDHCKYLDVQGNLNPIPSGWSMVSEFIKIDCPRPFNGEIYNCYKIERR